jgi:glycosyltransferase involved in cell wall biosynthesis
MEMFFVSGIKIDNMHIVNIVPGFGGTFYCGNCLRDSGYTEALRDSGHESTTIPIYLPLSMDHVAQDDEVPVFYGAISVYLKQKFSLFRNMPLWLENFFNAPFFLKLAAKRAGSTRAEGLEEMTISMLKGHEGYQSEELDILINYLKHHAKADVIHLSNALLLGLAKKIKEELDIPVVCSLQDEDVWIDAMRPDYVPRLWDMMAEKAKDIDAFIPVSHYFSDVMRKKMKLKKEKVHVVHVGIEPQQYTFEHPVRQPMKIGYMSRLNEENGFGVVVDAFIQLKQKGAFCDCQLKITGGHTGDDVKYIRKQRRKLKRAGFLDDVEFLEMYEGEKKRKFLSSLSVLTVPVLKGEAFGLYQLEALASGTPIVQPRLGAFPEIIEMTGGGKVYSPNTPAALATALSEVLTDPDLLASLAEKGHAAVKEKFDVQNLTQKMVEIYSQTIDQNSSLIPNL